MDIKATINKWDLIKLKSSCTMKETIIKVKKTAFRMEKNNSKWSNWQRINLKNIQATPEAQFQKNKWPNKKMGQRTKQTFLQRRCRWLRNTWKDAQHHSLSEKCKLKPQWGTISCQSEWQWSKSLQAINAGEGVEKREPSYTVGGNANWYSHYGEQCGDSLKNWK